MDSDLLLHFKTELTQRAKESFETWVTMLLRKKHGQSLWRAGPSRDGGIDFLTADGTAFQIYGTETARGRKDQLKAKVEHDLPRIRATITERELTADNIVFLTNVQPSDEIVGWIQRVEGKHEELHIWPLNQTAEYLYDVYYPFQELDDYRKCQMEDLPKEWPYALDEGTFVSVYDYAAFWEFHETEIATDATTMDFLCQHLAGGSVVLMAYYGMGKTTISRYLFKNWHRYAHLRGMHPVFIDLKNRRLVDFGPETIWETLKEAISNRISVQDSARPGRDQDRLVDLAPLPRLLQRMFQCRKLSLVFDGIDEAFSSPSTITDLLRLLAHNGGSGLLTSRLEFGLFVDAAAMVDSGTNLAYVHLAEWGEAQWLAYMNGCLKDSDASRASITEFFTRVQSRAYEELPSRPLFLKMLFDLETDASADAHVAAEGVRIRSELRDNLAEIYYKFIRWKVLDDTQHKAQQAAEDGKFRQRTFSLPRTFELLAWVANQEYWFSCADMENTEKRMKPVTIEDVRRATAQVGIGGEWIEHGLIDSTLFSILRTGKDPEERDTLVSFSHKSFAEYLFAFNLAECLLEKKDELEVRRQWGTFQTHEVSKHFQNELKRRRVECGQGVEEFRESIANRIANYLVDYDSGENGNANHWMEYSEFIEELLYYTGKLKLRNDAITAILRRAYDRPESFHPTYHRTAALALAEIEGTRYCESYVQELLDDPGARKRNRDIQVTYYSENLLNERLWTDIEKHMAGETTSIIALKVFTYLTARERTLDETDDLLESLSVMRSHFRRKGEFGLVRLLSQIPTLWKSLWWPDCPL